MKRTLLTICFAALALAAATLPAHAQVTQQIRLTNAELMALMTPVTSTLEIQAGSEGGYVRFRPASGDYVQRNTQGNEFTAPLDVLPDLICRLNTMYNPVPPTLELSGGRIRMQFRFVPRRPQEVEIDTRWNPAEDSILIPNPPGIEVSAINLELSFTLFAQGNSARLSDPAVQVDGDWLIRGVLEAHSPFLRRSINEGVARGILQNLNQTALPTLDLIVRVGTSDYVQAHARRRPARLRDVQMRDDAVDFTVEIPNVEIGSTEAVASVNTQDVLNASGKTAGAASDDAPLDPVIAPKEKTKEAATGDQLKYGDEVKYAGAGQPAPSQDSTLAGIEEVWIGRWADSADEAGAHVVCEIVPGPHAGSLNAGDIQDKNFTLSVKEFSEDKSDFVYQKSRGGGAVELSRAAAGALFKLSPEVGLQLEADKGSPGGYRLRYVRFDDSGNMIKEVWLSRVSALKP